MNIAPYHERKSFYIIQLVLKNSYIFQSHILFSKLLFPLFNTGFRNAIQMLLAQSKLRSLSQILSKEIQEPNSNLASMLALKCILLTGIEDAQHQDSSTQPIDCLQVQYRDYYTVVYHTEQRRKPSQSGKRRCWRKERLHMVGMTWECR